MRQLPAPAIATYAIGLMVMGTLCLLALTQENTNVEAQGATALSVRDCTEVEQGDIVNLEIIIRNVEDLLAWEIYFAYDRELMEVAGRDVRQFLDSGPNSNVFDLSDPVPNSTGLYRLGAADVALGGTAESGSGVLATVILRANREGVSPAAIYRSQSSIGPRLTAEGGANIGDSDGDQIFDGIIESGQIAIGRSCEPVAPTPDPDLIPSPLPTPPDPGITGSPAPTLGPGDPSPTAAGDNGTDDPGNGPSDPGSTDDPDDATPAPGASGQPGDDGESGDGTSADGPAGGGGDSGSSSGPNNTLWAIVLIFGGVSLGLGITYAVAMATRRTA